MKKSLLHKLVFRYLFGLLLALSSLAAPTQVAPKPPIYVLVHSAWHGGWCWQPVSARLRAAGATVYAPSLSGMGEHANTLTPAIDLNTHITDIVNLLVAEDLHNVVLVGHSYAGLVIAGVADRMPERLRQLVFLDAVLAENGQSLVATHPREVQAAFAAAAAPSHGLSMPIRSTASFGITDPATVRWADARLTPQPYRCFTQPLVLQHSYNKGLTLSFITCTKPELTVLKVFADRTRHNPHWTYYELPTGHDAMLSQPLETATLLQKIGGYLA